MPQVEYVFGDSTDQTDYPIICLRDPGGTNHELKMGNSGAFVGTVPLGFDATVGTGGTYTDLQAAITGVGGTDIKLLFVSDVTEDSDVAIPASSTVFINLWKYKLTMGTNQFTYSAAANVIIRGNGVESGAELEWGFTGGAKILFGDASFITSVLDIEGILLDNNSDTNFSYLADGIQKIREIKFEVPNKAGCGLQLSSLVVDSVIDTIEIIGGGPASAIAITIGGGQAMNLTFSGQYSAAAPALSLNNSSSNVSGVLMRHTTNKTSIVLNSSLSNVKTWPGTPGLDIVFQADEATLTHAELDGGNVDFQDQSNCRVTNVRTTGLLDLSDIAAGENFISNCEFGSSAVTIAGENNKISNSDFLGGITITGDQNIIDGCKVGADAGGGSNTITVNSGATNNIISDTLVDADISDSGTGTVLDYVIY